MLTSKIAVQKNRKTIAPGLTLKISPITTSNYQKSLYNNILFLLKKCWGKIKLFP